MSTTAVRGSRDSAAVFDTSDLWGDLAATTTAHVSETIGTGEQGDDWRETPAEFDHFVTSKEHLDLPELYPIQREAVRKLLGDDAKMIFGGPEQPDRTYELERVWQILVALWGKGSGKDYISSIVVCYLVHVLLCMRDPQRFLGQAPGENLDVVNVAYNADQAQKVFFTKFVARLDRWRWLHDRFNVFKAGRAQGSHKPGLARVDINADFVEFPRCIRAHSRHAQNESYEGLNIIAWVMDEASAFLSKLKMENAAAIFSTLRSSARTRFKGRWVGFILSFPRHGDDFTMKKIAEAERLGEKGGMLASGPHRCWDVNLMYSGDPMVDVGMGHMVPLSLVADYETDPEDSKAKYECDPPAAVDALIKFPERLDQAVAKGRRSMIEWEPTITRREVAGPDGTTRVREFVAVKVKKWGRRLPRGTRMFFHGDPAYSGDAFALAIGHGVPATVMRHVPAREVLTAEQCEERGVDPDSMVEWEMEVTRTIIDALIVWRPDPKRDRQVDLLNVKEVLHDLRKHHRIHAGSFDQFESAETVQELQAAKLNVENEQWSNPFQLLIYRGARSVFYNDLVTLPDDPAITSDKPMEPGALYELKRVQLIEGRKIDHPEGGSKDLADAIVRVIHHVGELGKKGGLSFGTVHGHPAAYGHGQKLEGRRPQDPRRTPSPATPHMREKEKAARQERPLDVEVSPAAAPPSARVLTAKEARELSAQAADERERAAPSRLGFGSIQR